MGVLDDLALSGVDRVERSLGPRAALRTLMPLLDTLPAGRGRARGVLRAIGYAAELNERELVESLAVRWSVEAQAKAKDARLAIVALAAHPAAAIALAYAEVQRTRGDYDEAAAHYALGRALEAAGRIEDALAEHDVAIRLSGEQPLLRACASARAVRALLALGRRDEAAQRASALLPLERAPAEDRLAIAVAALDAPGRYKRAAALDVLEQLAQKGGDIGRSAIALAAAHAERAGRALSSIEADRVRAVLAHHPGAADASARLAALLAIAEDEPGALARGARTDAAAESLLPRARAVADGNAAGPRPEAGGRVLVGWLGVAIAAALREKNRHEARALLDELTERVKQGARVEAPVWTAAVLAVRDERLSQLGRELARALLDAEGEPPPEGYLDVAEALEARGADELAIIALRRAAARREPRARARLSALLRHRGWQAADAGDRPRALALLREARALAGS